MKHLSEAQIFEYIDRLMPAADARTADAHCASCAQCRQRVEFHRALARAAAQPAAGLLADDFAERVMRRSNISPQRVPRFSWILRNSSNIIAMVVVLGILAAVGYFSAPGPDVQQDAAGTSVYTNIFSAWDTISAAIMSVFTKHTADVIPPGIASQSEKVFGNVFWLGAAAFLLLALADALRHRLKAPEAISR